MKVVHTTGHRQHDPQTETQWGTSVPYFESPDRADRIAETLGADPAFDFVPPDEHDAELLRRVHDPALVDFVETAWSRWREGTAPDAQLIPDTILHPAMRDGMGDPPVPEAPTANIGSWCFDTMTPIVPGTYRAARGSVDVALTTAGLVLGGERVAYGLCRPPGHHAARAMYGGYCFFNNAAVTAEQVVAATGEKVAILDVDYHHGNGTQQIFYARGDVLYVSLHADPMRAFPYFVGHADETGADDGAGTTFNLPLSAGCTDTQYLDTLERALERIADFGAPFLVVSLGLDTYGEDPIADFALTTPVFHTIGARVRQLGLPTVVLQEGGYHVGKLGENAHQWLTGIADPSR